MIDYQQQNFTQGAQRYDLILDNVSNHSLSEIRRVLEPTGTLVMIGGSSKDPWLGPLMQPLKAALLSPFVSEQLVFMLAELNQADLNTLSKLMQAGKVKPVIDRRYTLSEVPAAIRYLEEGHARGKVVVNLE